mgnify:FL=1
MAKKVLIIEDSQLVMKIIRHVVKLELEDLEPLYASSLKEATEVFQKNSDDVYAALADLTLPDASNGEVVDFLLQNSVPTIVLTASVDDSKREALLGKGVVDYVIKESRFSYSYAVGLLNRLYRNKDIKVLVAEDSTLQRNFIMQRLAEHQFQTFAASNGVEALEQLAEHPDIKLLITDYHMPEMDGFELVKTIRHNINKSDLIIIGLSIQEINRGSLSAKFIKNGANDFLSKPFNHEEFNCRIKHNIESLELLEAVRYQANNDYLTNLPNRRCFFSAGEELHKQAKVNQSNLSAAILDLDLFKRVNDDYGHSAGDKVLKFFSEQIRHYFSDYLTTLGRTGGEEFCILMPGLTSYEAGEFIDEFRQELSEQTIFIDDDTQLTISFSCGVSDDLGLSLDQQIGYADENLYRAKEAGRNQVVY